jgi:transcriptional regulator with XRE-family HTH domain
VTPEERRDFGARVAKLRKDRGLTQAELAARIGRTASWVSQVERGVQPVVRLDVLQLLAQGLEAPLQTLQPNAPAEPQEHADVEQPNDLDGARLVISGHPALRAVLGDDPGEHPGLLELSSEARHVWDLAHSAEFAQLSTELERLVPRLEGASRAVEPDQQGPYFALLSQTYQALSAAFVRQDEADAAWVAADRAIRAAELAERPHLVCAAIVRLTQAFVRLKRFDQAEHAAASAIDALQEHTAGKAAPEALSVLGALHLALAFVHARAGRRMEARAEIANAREVAARIGEDRNDYDLEFGPTNVEIQAVSTAVELGDAGEALDIGHTIDAAQLSAERRSRLLMDLGRAYTQRRQIGEALDCLLRAEELAPESARSHVAARSSIRELMLLAGRAASPELVALADRADAHG